jgi:hypothetical protein
MTTIGSWKPAPIAQPYQHAYTANNSNYQAPPPPQQPAAVSIASTSWESQFPALSSASTSAWESQFPALLPSNAPQSTSSSTIGNKNNSNDTRH